MRERTVQIDLTLEELTFESILNGEQIGVEVTVFGTAYPGEPPVNYYADGSGYPGSPPSFEYKDCKVTRVWGADWDCTRADRPSLFDRLDVGVNARIMDRLDDIERQCLEQLADEPYEPDDREYKPDDIYWD